MSSMKFASIALLTLVISGCAGPAKNQGNDIQQAAERLVGQPAKTAFDLFGKPDHGMGPSSYGSGGFYAWNRLQTHVGPDKVFVQTGTEYVGEQTTYAVIGGGGATGIMPVNSTPVYRPVGYYENETVIDYFCNITLFTDAQDIITQASVIDCANKK